MSKNYGKNVKKLLCWCCIFSLCIASTAIATANVGDVYTNGIIALQICDSDTVVVCRYDGTNNSNVELNIASKYDLPDDNGKSSSFRVIGIEDGVFAGYQNFTYIGIEAGTGMKIGKSAFENIQVKKKWWQEKGVQITAEELTEIGESAFANSDIKGNMTINGMNGSIRAEAFKNMNLTGKLYISGEIDELGDYALSGMDISGLSMSAVICHMGDGVYKDTYLGSNNIIPLSNSLKTIGSRVFEGTNLLGIKLPECDTVEYATDDTFEEGMLIIIPEGLTNLEVFHFDKYQNLKFQTEEGLSDDSIVIQYLEENGLTYRKGENGEWIYPKPVVKPTKEPEPTETVVPTEKPEPTATVEPTEEPKPTATVEPTEEPEPTATIMPTKEPKPTATVEPTKEPEPTATVEPTKEPEPTEKPEPTATVEPTKEPEPTVTPKPTATPRPTATPKPTATPRPTATPKPTATSKSTATPKPTMTPRPTATPKPTATSKSTATPRPTEIPTPTTAPRPTETPMSTTPIPTDATTPEATVTLKSGDLEKIGEDGIYSDGKIKYRLFGKNKIAVMGVKNKNSTTISIPDKVTINEKAYKVVKIEKQAFKGMKNLKKVKVGNGIKKIENEAFAKCPKLKNIQFGTGLVNIGNKVFYNDKNIRKIIFKGTKLSKIGKKTFSGIKPKKLAIEAKWSKMKYYQKLINKAR